MTLVSAPKKHLYHNLVILVTVLSNWCSSCWSHSQWVKWCVSQSNFHPQVAPGICINNKTWQETGGKTRDARRFPPKNELPSLKLTAKAPENSPSQKETIVFQSSIFRCYVSFREGIMFNNFHVERSKNLLLCPTFKESFLIMGIQPPTHFM